MCLTHARRVTWEHCLLRQASALQQVPHLDRPSGLLNSVAETTSTVFCAVWKYTVRMDRTWCCNTVTSTILSMYWPGGTSMVPRTS